MFRLCLNTSQVTSPSLSPLVVTISRTRTCAMFVHAHNEGTGWVFGFPPPARTLTQNTASKQYKHQHTSKFKLTSK